MKEKATPDSGRTGDIVEFGYIDVSDIVQYLYCPRKVYFHRVAGITLTRPKMEVGREFHDRIEDSLRHRPDLLSCNVYLESKRYGIKGKVDAIIERDGEYIPVDIKYSKFRHVFYQWKMQLVAYAVLIEENFDCTVKRGYIYFPEIRKFVEVEISPTDKRRLFEIIKQVEGVIKQGVFPRATKSKKCHYCEMYKFCFDF